MAEEIKILDLISVFFSAFSCVVALCIHKRNFGLYTPVLLVLLIGFLVDSLSLVFAMKGIYISFLGQLYTIIEFITILFFFYLFFQKRSHTILISGLAALFLCYAAFDYNQYGFNSMSSYLSAVEAVILVGLAFLLFLFVMQNPLTQHLVKEGYFWINCGILIYFSGNLLLFLMMRTLSFAQLGMIWSPVHNSLNILFNTLLIIGFWKTKIKHRPSQTKGIGT